MSHLTGKPILISGAGRGLGEGLALHLAGMGAIVAVCDINGASAEKVAAAVRAAGGTAESYTVDLSKQANFKAVAADFAGKHGKLYALINNASVLVYEKIEAVTEDTLQRMLDAGLKTVFWGVQAFLENHEDGTDGRIINYSSPVAYRGRPNTGAYTAIKGAVATLTQVLAGELGPRGIRVNAIAPGSVPTPATLGFVTEEEYAKRAATIPLRRIGRVDDVTKAVAFLLGPDAEFINGAMLAIDGGIIAAG